MLRRALPLVLVAAALTAGCGSGDAPDEGPTGAAAVAAPAVVLRANLGAALDARAWLTAYAVRTTLIDGVNAPTAVAARLALDKATVTLARRYGTVSGREPQVLDLLRDEDTRWAELSRARATGNDEARAIAQATIADGRTRLARLLADAELSAESVEAQLEKGQDALGVALASVTTGSELAPDRTATAALRATRIAPELARAGKRRRPELEGSPRSPAADLAALAASAFTDHAYAQAATDAVVAAGARFGPRLDAARRALGASTDTLSQLVTAVHGENAGERFGKLWAAHTAAFVVYTRAKASGDVIGSTNALVALDKFRDGVQVLFAEVDPDAPKEPLARALEQHVDASTAAIRAEVVDSPQTAQRLLDSAAASQRLGRVLAARFATAFPERFPAV